MHECDDFFYNIICYPLLLHIPCVTWVMLIFNVCFSYYKLRENWSLTYLKIKPCSSSGLLQTDRDTSSQFTPLVTTGEKNPTCFCVSTLAHPTSSQRHKFRVTWMASIKSSRQRLVVSGFLKNKWRFLQPSRHHRRPLVRHFTKLLED